MKTKYVMYSTYVLFDRCVQGKLQSGDYPTLEACAKDVRLVWTNAHLYNPVSADD